MKYLNLLLLMFPLFLFGQRSAIDTTCFCGEKSPLNKRQPIVVEEMATYPGGNNALNEFIQKNTVLAQNENGEIKILFIINCKGETCGFRVWSKEGDISSLAETKIIETLSKMNKWNPATQRNKHVDITYKLQIKIKNGTLQLFG